MLNELVLLSTLIPGLMSSRYHALTTTIWLVKSLCKLSFLLQYLLHTNNHMKIYREISPQTMFYSTVVYYVPLLLTLIIYFLHVSTMMMTILGFFCGMIVVAFPYNGQYTYHSYSVSASAYFCFYGTILFSIYINVPYVTITILTISLLYLFLQILILSIISVKELLANNIKVVWKAVSVISVITYLLNYHYSEFSFVLAILGIVVITAVVLIVIDHTSVYAISFLIVLIVIYYISVLYESWTDNSIIPQVTCQLTVLGALLYTLGYDYAASLKTTATDDVLHV